MKCLGRKGETGVFGENSILDEERTKQLTPRTGYTQESNRGHIGGREFFQHCVNSAYRKCKEAGGYHSFLDFLCLLNLTAA